MGVWPALASSFFVLFLGTLYVALDWQRRHGVMRAQRDATRRAYEDVKVENARLAIELSRLRDKRLGQYYVRFSRHERRRLEEETESQGES